MFNVTYLYAVLQVGVGTHGAEGEQGVIESELRVVVGSIEVRSYTD
jgi:hypothetical protein